MVERFAVGVEEEYHLVEPPTGALRSRAGVVRSGDRTGQVGAEVQDSMLEIGTPVCADASEVLAALRERRFQASAAASAEDLEVLSAGLHPFSGWQGQELTDADRPRMLAGLYGQLLRQQQICGMHVHVAVSPALDRVQLMNVVRAYTPHLLALSCSSPFYLGEDTRFASFRAIVWRGFPFAGAPPRFDSADEYARFVGMLIRAGMLPDARTVYWSVRPSARYETLEFRICDACPTIADAVAITALTRALVVAAAEDRLQPLGSSLTPGLQDTLLAENEWITARDGLEAVLLAPERPDCRLPIRAAIEELYETLAPIAASLGDREALRGIDTILARGNAADRMRERVAAGESVHSLVDWLIGETRAGTGIDRRRESR